ncbi:MAG: hypothetical protein ACK4TA_19335 [Saprospiraceae bacterium]
MRKVRVLSFSCLLLIAVFSLSSFTTVDYAVGSSAQVNYNSTSAVELEAEATLRSGFNAGRVAGRAVGKAVLRVVEVAFLVYEVYQAVTGGEEVADLSQLNYDAASLAEFDS